MTDLREQLIEWLSDAYDVERRMEQVLAEHGQAAEDDAALRWIYENHLLETRRHAELIEECVRQLGGDVAGGEPPIARITGALSGALGDPVDDELVRNAIADYSMEHFEIAGYRALSEAADALGELDVSYVCRRILDDEERMASALEQHLPTMVRRLFVGEGVKGLRG